MKMFAILFFAGLASAQNCLAEQQQSSYWQQQSSYWQQQALIAESDQNIRACQLICLVRSNFQAVCADATSGINETVSICAKMGLDLLKSLTESTYGSGCTSCDMSVANDSSSLAPHLSLIAATSLCLLFFYRGYR